MSYGLEFQGERKLPSWYNGGYDCRICMAFRSHEEEDRYEARTGRKNVWKDGRLQYHVMRIQVGELIICLPDHDYAHADHDKQERLMYGEMLEARFPRDECERLDVYGWLTENSD